MSLTNHALLGGRSAPQRGGDPSPIALVVGGGGALGSAVLETMLSSRCFSKVKVLVERGLTVAIHGLDALVVERFDEAAADGGAPAQTDGMPEPTPLAQITPIAQIAIVVFDRERHANRREQRFVRPHPHELGVVSRWLARRGVRQLIVVLPHSPVGLPNALKAGLANLDEQAATSLGFDHVVFVRSAQPPTNAQARQWLQRVADGMLAQLRIMVASSNQPVRAGKVAQFVVELAARLPASESRTRIAPPELVWQAAQMRDPAELVRAWLVTHEVPEVNAPRMRL